MKRPHRQPQREHTAELTKPVRPLKKQREHTAGGPVAGCGQHLLPVGREDRRKDSAFVTLQSAQALPRGSRPHLPGQVEGCGQHLLAIGGEDCRLDRIERDRPRCAGHSPEAADHTFAPSQDAVSTCWPSAEKTAELTQQLWPFKVRRHSPRSSRPHLRGPVTGSGQHLLAVGREDRRIDVVDAVLSLEGEQALTTKQPTTTSRSRPTMRSTPAGRRPKRLQM